MKKHQGSHNEEKWNLNRYKCLKKNIKRKAKIQLQEIFIQTIKSKL